MFNDLVWALAAALILALIGVVFTKPRSLLTAWVRRLVRRAHRKVFHLDRLERVELAIERQAQYLTQEVYNKEGNPDDEYRSDWYRWFTGDPDANVDYSRKQERDRERLARGEFGPRRPNGL